MAQEYDVSVKDLIEDDHDGWARRFNARPVLAASLVDANVSTVTAMADKALLVEDDAGKRLLAFEPMSYHDGDAPGRAHLYATVLHRRHALAVRMIVLLLRPEANAKSLTGKYEVREPGEAEPYETFRYEVVKLWEEPLAPLLAAGLGVLPLAMLTDEAMADPAPALKHVTDRLAAETTPAQADKILTATYLLMGLRYDGTLVERLFEEMKSMEGSTTYQAVIRKGEAAGRQAEARAYFLRLARRKLGEPAPEVLARVEAMGDVERLEALGEKLFAVTTWDDLLAD